MIRLCNYCDKDVGSSGFVLDPGTEYYCDERCMYERISPEEYTELSNEGLAYWTEFEKEESKDE